jgi:hypothetical protein
VPEASVGHIGSASTGAYALDKRRPDYWFFSRHYFYEKNYGKAYAYAADAAWLTGQMLWKMRRLVERKPRCDPEYMTRDFLAHMFGLPRARE